jgi:excisionase family DNA binding protein
VTGLRLELPTDVLDELVEAIAERAAAIVLERLRDDGGSPPSPYLSVDEAAELLRAKPQRVYDLLSDGRLTRFKDGARVLVRRTEVEAHLAGATHANGVAPALPTGAGSRAGRRVPR